MVNEERQGEGPYPVILLKKCSFKSLKTDSWVREMAILVNVPGIQPGNLSSIPGTHIKVERTNSTKLSDPHMHTMV